jgi:DUF971 family protein
MPTDIRLHQKSKLLELHFDDGSKFSLPYEYLRVFTPSAEARGHGPGQETLQVGKRDVTIERVDPVGNYAIQPKFSDGHDTGIYSWDLLYNLGRNHDELWALYLEQLEREGGSRDPAPEAPGGGGGSGGGGCSSGGCSGGGCA